MQPRAIIHPKKPRRNRKKRLVAAILLVFLPIFFYTQNNWLSLTRITVQSLHLPMGFDGFRIVHLTDLHGKGFGKAQKTLLAKVNKQRPDIIVFTGDLIDQRNMGGSERALVLMKGLVQIAPVYLVTGNHDSTMREFEPLADQLIDAGIHVLRNESLELEHKGDKLLLLGIDDPLFAPYPDNPFDITSDRLNQILQAASPAEFKLLLFHRPELFSLFVDAGIDLTLSGHAHGGQFRLPFVGGIIAPGQGFFPAFTAGAYEENNAVMIVSRGLGNSVIPQRLFNRPEVITITLRKS